MTITLVRLYHDHVLVKEPGTQQRTPWHQDIPYYNVDGRLNVSMWCPVDPVARESTLELVAGTHLGPWFMPRSFLDGQAKWFPEGALAEMPDFDADPERYPVLGWALEPGDAVLRLAARGQHQDGQIRLRTQIGREIEPAFARHHHVEHEAIEVDALDQLAGFGGVRRGGDPEAVGAEESLEQAAQPRVVVDHQKMRIVGGVHRPRPE